MTTTTADTLLQLYKSAIKMAASNDADVLLDYLLEDLRNSTEFERILLLQLEQTDLSLTTERHYGFKETLSPPRNLPFTADTGLLHRVYTEREPLTLTHSIKEHISTVPAFFKLNSDSQSVNKTTGEQQIKLCLLDPDSQDTEFTKKRKFRHYSILPFDMDDKNISSLLGNIQSFLILPICDHDNFFGFIIADKSNSGKPISYNEIRHSWALAKHSAHPLRQALKHKQMLTKIEYLENFSQSITQNLRSGMIVVNQLMNITETNKAAERTLGYSQKELLGKPLNVLLNDTFDGHKYLFTDGTDESDSDMDTLVETPMYKKNGQTFPAEICYSAIKNKHNEIQGLSCIFRDITARKAMEKDLSKIDKLTSLGELAGGIAHEIKNPLAGIAGAIQIISRSYEEESQHRTIFNEVLNQVNRLDSIVNGLLQFARPGKTNFSTVHLEEIMEKTLSATAPQLDARDITIIRNFCNNPPVIQGDRDQLQQVLSNILLNAIDSCDSRGKITIETYWKGCNDTPLTTDSQCNTSTGNTTTGQITISITDNGKGIDSASLETIFNPFHTTKSNGTGLGLSISHRIIEQHNGTVSVKSSLGQGATFSVHLPICVSEKVLINSSQTL